MFTSFESTCCSLEYIQVRKKTRSNLLFPFKIESVLKEMILCNFFRSYKNQTGKMRSFPEAVRPLVPIGIFMIIGSIWVIYSPSNIIEVDPRAMYFMTGTIFSNICVR